MSHDQAKRVSRREFLAGAAAAGASAAGRRSGGAEVAGSAFARLAEKIPTRSDPPKEAHVVVVKDARAVSPTGLANPQFLGAMLEAALRTLTGAEKAADAWKKLFKKDDFVVLKYNEMGGLSLATSPALCALIADGLGRHVGVEARRIVRIGRCTRYRGKYAGWGKPVKIHSAGITTRFAKVFTDHATALVSAPVCKTHRSRGPSCLLKLHLGSVKNPQAFHGRPDMWDGLWKNLPELNTLGPIKGKTRLVVMDALRPQYDLGPTNSPAHRFPYGALIASTDPLAVEALGLKVIEDARRKAHLRPLPYGARMTAFAQAIGVGLGDLKKIKVTRIDLPAGKGT